MSDPRKKILLAGITGMLSSYNNGDKKIARDYLQENLYELLDIADEFPDQIMMQIVMLHKNDLRKWLKDMRNGEDK